MTERDPLSLEARLADLSIAVEFPPTPAMAQLVGDRLRAAAGGAALGTARRWWPVRLPSLGRGALLALLATLLLVGVVAAIGIATGGLRLIFNPESLPALPSLPNQPGIGQQVTLEAARSRAGFALRLPSLPVLGEPDQVYLMEPPLGGTVTLVYAERPGYPLQPGREYGMVITEFRADIVPEAFEKLIGNGVSVTTASVHGHAAYWVAGGEHFFFYRDAGGQLVTTTLRLAGDALIWEEEGVTHRVEGAPSLSAAIVVAESLR
jgi:hypothetical protein